MSRFIRPIKLRLPSNTIIRHATWLEIFFDLIFAVIIFNLSDRLFHQLTFKGIFQCAALLVPVIWTWASYTVFAARFDNNDGLHWLLTFVIMFASIIMAIQIPTALENGTNGFIFGFLIAQISLLLLYTRTIYDPLTPTNMIILYLIGFGFGALFWLAALFANQPFKFFLMIFGMIIYLLIPWIGRRKILSKAPLDTSYIPERFASFTIIIMGQIITSVVFGLETTNWSIASFVISIMAFSLAIIVWSQYYRFNTIADYKCTLGSGQPYIYIHIPLIISLIVIGVCTEYFIAKPTVINHNVKNIFCLGIIIYLFSFYLLQYITIRKIKIRAIAYFTGIIAISLLNFAFSLSPMTMMSWTLIIFIILFSIQYWLGLKTTRTH